MRWEIKEVRYIKLVLRDGKDLTDLPDIELTNVIKYIINSKLLGVKEVDEALKDNEYDLLFNVKISLFSESCNKLESMTVQDIATVLEGVTDISLIAAMIASYIYMSVVKYVVSDEDEISTIVAGIEDTVIWNIDPYTVYIIFFPGGNGILLKSGSIVNSADYSNKDALLFKTDITRRVVNEIGKFSKLVQKEFIKYWKM